MMQPRRVAIVGTCASGKSSVVARLRVRGVDAFAVAQEHSVVSELWNHRQPDHVVVLEARLETVRARRDDPVWPEWIYDLQQERLISAREHADVVVQTDDRGLDEVVDTIINALAIDVAQ
jgi:broad-specificity NMP kinase